MRWNKRRKNVLISCCGAHVIQDGLSSTLYVLLPVLAQTFGLSYSQVGILRALNNGAMALLEMSSGVLSERFGERNLLAFGLVCSGVGYVVMALSSSLWALIGIGDTSRSGLGLLLLITLLLVAVGLFVPDRFAVPALAFECHCGSLCLLAMPLRPVVSGLLEPVEKSPHRLVG